MSEPIPVDAIVAQALEKRPVHPVGTTVWARRADNGLIEPYEVLAVVMILTNVTAFHMHYAIAAPRQYQSRVLGRRVVSWHNVYPTYEDAVKGGQQRPPMEDPIDTDLTAAVNHHRKVAVAYSKRA